MAVAVGGEGEGAGRIVHRKIGAAQAQCPPQGCAGEHLPADGLGRDVARGAPGGRAEPTARGGSVRGQPQPGQRCLHLRLREGEGDFVVGGAAVGGAVHRDQIGQGCAPDVFAGLGPAVGEGKIARSGGSAVIAEHLVRNLVHKGRKAGEMGLVLGAPVAAQHGVRQVALPPRGVGGEPALGTVRCVVAAVEDITVGCDGLCLEGFVRPVHGHLRCHGSQQVGPFFHLLHGPSGEILDAKHVRVPRIGGWDGKKTLQKAVLFRRGRGRGALGRGRRTAQDRLCQPIPCAGQQQGAQKQRGTEEQKGFFHFRHPPKPFWTSIHPVRGKKAQKRGPPALHFGRKCAMMIPLICPLRQGVGEDEEIEWIC